MQRVNREHPLIEYTFEDIFIYYWSYLIDMATAEIKHAVTLLLRRKLLLEHLIDGATDRRILVKKLPSSRSTVYRSLDQLEQYGIVTEAAGTYELTTYGYLLAQEYQQFEQVTEGLQNARELLTPLPPDTISSRAIADAEIVVSERHAPTEPVDVVVACLQKTGNLKGFSPVVLPQFVAPIHGQLNDGALHAELILEDAGVSHLRKEYPTKLEAALTSENVDLFQTDQHLPYGLLLVEGSKQEVCVALYGEFGHLRGTIWNDSRDAIEWGNEVYHDYKSQATNTEL